MSHGGHVLPVSLGHAYFSHFAAFPFMLMKCRFTEEPHLNRFTTYSGNLIFIQFSTFVIVPPNGCSIPTVTFLYLEYLNNLISKVYFSQDQNNKSQIHGSCPLTVLTPKYPVVFLVIYFVNLSSGKFIKMTVIKLISGRTIQDMSRIRPPKANILHAFYPKECVLLFIFALYQNPKKFSGRLSCHFHALVVKVSRKFFSVSIYFAHSSVLQFHLRDELVDLLTFKITFFLQTHLNQKKNLD